MIQIISGVKGKGKTKFLIQKANEAVKAANGSVVYLDKNNKHMYELSNRIRLINVGDFPIDTYDAFLGFICGLISQDNDLEHMFFDSFLTKESLRLLPRISLPRPRWCGMLGASVECSY